MFPESVSIPLNWKGYRVREILEGYLHHHENMSI